MPDERIMSLGKLSVFIDKKYLFPALVMLQSAADYTPKDIEFVVGTFEGEMTDLDLTNIQLFASKILRKVTVVEISKDDLIKQIGPVDNNAHFGYAAFGRLQLQKQIPERHVYSDVDVLFNRGSQTLIRALPVSELVGFVPQASALANSGLEYDENNSEFFAGFILWPERPLRPVFELRQPIEWVTPYSSHDQALLNILIGQSYLKLSENLCQLDAPTLKASDFSAGIIHYFGNWKPWQSGKFFRDACRKTKCSWTLWFDREALTLSTLGALSLSKWTNELRNKSKNTASANFKALSLLTLISKFIGVSQIMRKVIGPKIGTEIHGIH
jgi:lipopolysaccharide biosynthesis glycosyltransferase